MPRFENEGVNPDKIKRNVDRTVPQDENYYGNSRVDLNFNNRENVVKDNQVQSGINPCNEVDKQYTSRQSFQSETADDYIVKKKAPQQSNAPKGKSNKSSGKKRKHKKPKIAQIIIAIILIIVIIIVGTLALIINRVNYNDKIENAYVSSSELTSSDDVKNILLLGVDKRAWEDEDADTRSDTMMLVSLDTVHHQIKLTSFLRDTWVYIPTLDYKQRLNAACSSGGYQGVVDAIEYNFGIAIDGYAVVDFEMFEVLVDSLGGVDVDVTEAEANEVTNNPYVYGDVVLESGEHTLTGEQALAYCRIRKIDTDFVRTERQRTVMTAIINNAKHSNPIKLLNMAYKSAPYIETDLSKSEIRSLAMTAVTCLSGDIEQQKVPFDGTWDYSTINGNSVITINLESNKQQLYDYIYGE
jgi:LCP family protein required for cell wall assembly